jgi:hypothetical protein
MDALHDEKIMTCNGKARSVVQEKFLYQNNERLTMIQVQIPLLKQELLLPQLFPELDSVFRSNVQSGWRRHYEEIV